MVRPTVHGRFDHRRRGARRDLPRRRDRRQEGRLLRLRRRQPAGRVVPRCRARRPQPPGGVPVADGLRRPAPADILRTHATRCPSSGCGRWATHEKQRDGVYGTAQTMLRSVADHARARWVVPGPVAGWIRQPSWAQPPTPCTCCRRRDPAHPRRWWVLSCRRCSTRRPTSAVYPGCPTYVATSARAGSR